MLAGYGQWPQYRTAQALLTLPNAGYVPVLGIRRKFHLELSQRLFILHRRDASRLKTTKPRVRTTIAPIAQRALRILRPMTGYHSAPVVDLTTS